MWHAGAGANMARHDKGADHAVDPSLVAMYASLAAPDARRESPQT